MDGGRRYSVVVLHRDGHREVKASNITLESAQAAHGALIMAHPQALVTIEPPPPGSPAGRKA